MYVHHNLLWKISNDEWLFNNNEFLQLKYRVEKNNNSELFNTDWNLFFNVIVILTL